MATARTLLGYCITLMCVGSTLANPWFFLNDNKASNCGKHPDQAWGLHLAPQPDSGVAFSLVSDTGVAVAATDALCPGTNYTVSVSWVGDERALLTTSLGSWAFQPVGSCPVSTYSVDKQPSITSTLLLPCDLAAGSTVELKVSHTRIARAFYQASVTFGVSGTCRGAACPQPPGPSSPAPPAPETPTPSPVPSPQPSPNPKRCKRRRSRSLKSVKAKKTEM